ncbi:MAG: hypothetical protein E6230_11500 [Paenibacillus dendritiformis]|uniref:hypothetical protein n=1 Tax=uncultured Paenibacillus sp. TaxID=227322 RepID=UPI0025D9C718|nr:hypothetical protein [uncultured Paenibacillus sp.]MDU5142805.1 hypothetical protein [Paenibacillus dendritiformis]
MKKVLLTLTAVVTMLAAVPLGAGATSDPKDDQVKSPVLLKDHLLKIDTGTLTDNKQVSYVNNGNPIYTRDAYTVNVTVNSPSERATLWVCIDGKESTELIKGSNSKTIYVSGSHVVSIKNKTNFPASATGVIYYNP